MKKLLFGFIALTIFASCKNTGGIGKEMTVDGYKYTILEKGKGEKVKESDVVSFEINILSPTDSILQASSSFPQTPSMLIDTKTPNKYGPNPILTLLAKSSVGDRFSLVMPKDSMKGAPPAMKNFDFVKYVISVKKSLSKDVVDAENKANLEKSIARESEVAELVKNTIADYKANKSKLITLPSGLKYIVHEEGTGSLPEIGKSVTVNYYGALLETGKMFDNSFKRGQDFSFPLGKGRVIKGWDEGIAKLKKGTKATLIIPSELGYGKAGAGADIPGGSTLVFYVELGE